MHRMELPWSFLGANAGKQIYGTFQM